MWQSSLHLRTGVESASPLSVGLQATPRSSAVLVTGSTKCTRDPDGTGRSIFPLGCSYGTNVGSLEVGVCVEPLYTSRPVPRFKDMLMVVLSWSGTGKGQVEVNSLKWPEQGPAGSQKQELVETEVKASSTVWTQRGKWSG